MIYQLRGTGRTAEGQKVCVIFPVSEKMADDPNFLEFAEPLIARAMARYAGELIAVSHLDMAEVMEVHKVLTQQDIDSEPDELDGFTVGDTITERVILSSVRLR